MTNLGIRIGSAFAAAMLLVSPLSAVAGEDLLAFTYVCWADEKEESIANLTTTQKMSTHTTGSQTFCRKRFESGSIDLDGCKARRTDMRAAIENVAGKACDIVDDDGGGVFIGDGISALQVYCRKKEERFIPIILAACTQTLSFQATTPP
jgi:hypothetical protein